MDHVTILLRQSPVGPGTDCKIATLLHPCLHGQYTYPGRWFQPAGVILFSFILFLCYPLVIRHEKFGKSSFSFFGLHRLELSFSFRFGMCQRLKLSTPASQTTSLRNKKANSSAHCLVVLLHPYISFMVSSLCWRSCFLYGCLSARVVIFCVQRLELSCSRGNALYK